MAPFSMAVPPPPVGIKVDANFRIFLKLLLISVKKTSANYSLLGGGATSHVKKMRCRNENTKYML